MTQSVFATSIRPKLNGKYYTPAALIVCVDGTVYPGAPFPPVPATNDGNGFYSGFASAMAGGLMNLQDGLFASICVGYKASTVPMWPSVQQGRAIAVAQIDAYQKWFHSQFGTYAPTFFTGYSQGTMVTDQIWLLDILSPTGVLHYLLPFVYRSYQFGHIFRSPGIAWANAAAGLSQSIITNSVESGGIGCVLDLTPAQTNYVAPDGKPVVWSAANPGDLYTSCPTGLQPWTNLAAVAKTGQLFFKIVMQPTFIDIVSAATVLLMPVSAIEEAIHAGTFFAQGPNSPHYQYFPQLTACIDDALQLGLTFPYQPGY